MVDLQFLRCVDPSTNPISKSRHLLPHWSQGETCVFVTFRLCDSIPRAKLRFWRLEREEWLVSHPEPWDETDREEYGKLFGARLDEWLDAGSGSCVLDSPGIRPVVCNELQRHDGELYSLLAFVVMPNHVHVVFSPFPSTDISQIIQLWKGRSARVINQSSSKSGAVWQREYWDRLVRDARHLLHVVNYIRRNPLKAGRSDIPVYLQPGLLDALGKALAM